MKSEQMNFVVWDCNYIKTVVWGVGVRRFSPIQRKVNIIMFSEIHLGWNFLKRGNTDNRAVLYFGSKLLYNGISIQIPWGGDVVEICKVQDVLREFRDAVFSIWWHVPVFECPGTDGRLPTWTGEPEWRCSQQRSPTSKLSLSLTSIWMWLRPRSR